MRILVFSSVYKPGIGGIETHVDYLSKAMQKQGHQVVVVTAATHKNTLYKENQNGVRILRIPTLPIPKTRTFQFLALSSLVLLWEIFKWKPDVVHFHTFWPDYLITHFIHPFKSIVYTSHESRFLLMAEDPQEENKLNEVFKHIDAIIAPSQELLNVSKKYFYQKIAEYIPNAVDSEKFQPIQVTRKGNFPNNIEPESFIILCPRRLVFKNGVTYMVQSLPEIIQQVPKVVLIIAGEGPEEDNLRKQVNDLLIENHVIFWGSIPNDQMPGMYALADVVVLPSLKEATSIAGLEAMACGKVVVASNVGGLPEIINDNENGILVPAMDPHLLALALVRLQQDSEQRKKLGQEARKHVEKNFTWTIVAEKTYDFYLEVISNRNKKTKQKL